jgi:hypothetical protein
VESGYCRDESLVAAAIVAKKKKQELRALQEKENEFTIDEDRRSWMMMARRTSALRETKWKRRRG